MSAAASAAGGPPARVEWVDYARGIGIFLVVAGHTLGGLRNAGILADTPRLTFVIDWIYSFHMPLFFFLSGLFVRPAMRGTLAGFINGKVRSVVYPYVVWSVLQTLVQSGLGSATNRQADVASLLAIASRPIMQFWFLYALFLIFVLFGILYRAGLRGPGIFAFAVALYVYPHIGPLGPWGVAYSVANHMLYFAAGVVVATHVHGWIGAWAPRHALLATAIGGALVTVAVAVGLQTTVVGKPLVAAVGIAATTWLAAAMSAAEMPATVHQWGLLSLQIYVAHTIASAGFRIALQRLGGIGAPLVHLVGGIVVGLYVPILLNAVCERFGFRYAFTWPKGGGAALRQRWRGVAPNASGEPQGR